MKASLPQKGAYGIEALVFACSQEPHIQKLFELFRVLELRDAESYPHICVYVCT